MANKKEWTPEQKRAIEIRGKNILVSAGAGSGKTAVMTERVVKLVTEENVPLDEMLVVTFTDAAASEMRNRIRDKLKKRLVALATEGAGGEELAFVRKQLDDLPDAHISTFHAFAKHVVDDFFYLIDCDPERRVIDEGEKGLMLDEAMTELFDREYAEKRDDFMSLLDSYAKDQNDDGVRSMVLELLGATGELPGKFRIPEERQKALDPDAAGGAKSTLYRVFMDDAADMLRECILRSERTGELARKFGLTELPDKMGSEREDMLAAMKAFESGERELALGILDSIKYPVFKEKFPESAGNGAEIERKKKLINARRKEYKTKVRDIKNLFLVSDEKHRGIMRIAYPHTITLLRLTKELDRIYTGIKDDKKAMDYSDMQQFCLKVLEHEEAREYYRDKFSHIFIDEYQDTNPIQGEIMERIKRDDNMFMVGDIKQSIYGFRDADPELFAAKYRSYADSSDEEARSVRIDLNKNYRSTPEILSEINKMFEGSMKGYDDAASLKPGLDFGGAETADPETYIIDVGDTGFDPGEDEDGDPADLELEDMTNGKIEAMKVIEIIKQAKGKVFRDFKAEGGPVDRKLDYRDMVILMKSYKANVESYKEVFREAGVPLYIDETQGYFDTFEVNVLMSLLTVIDNKKQDIPFIALLRSEIFGFTCEELAMVRKYGKESGVRRSYVEDAMELSEDAGADEALRLKLKNAFDSIRRWQAYSGAMPLPELIWKVLGETGYYVTVGAMPGGAVRQANLRLLISKAENYVAVSGNSLYGFTRYVEKLKKNEINVSPAKVISENDNVVRMMTIHHSKGLEFPMVIVAQMGRRLWKNDPTKMCFDKEIGIGLKSAAPEYRIFQSNLAYDAISKKKKRDEAEEALRVLYVACTRAESMLYLVGTTKNIEGFRDRYSRGLTKFDTFFDIVKHLPGLTEVRAVDILNGRDRYKEGAAETGYESGASEEEREFVEERLGYEYPYEYAGGLKAKTSVTAILKEEHASEEGGRDAKKKRTKHIFDVPGFMTEDRKPAPTEIGAAYHEIMERIDFEKASEDDSYVAGIKEDLVREGVIERGAADYVEDGRIKAFFGTDLGKRVLEADGKGLARREQPFEMKLKVSGEDVLVQGVIDCYFEENGKITVLDYKTNAVDFDKPKEDEKKRIGEIYRKQLELYSKALKAATGKEIGEAYLYLFVLGEEIRVI